MPDDYRQLDGQAALVTGASRGIGRAIALRLARMGARIGVHYNTNRDKALAVVEEVRTAGGEAVAFQAEISEESAVAAMFSDFLQQFQQIDILVANAGLTKDQPLLRMKVADFDQVIATNLRGTFLCLKQAGRNMLRRRYGRIITMSSIVGVTGNSGQACYAASKAGIIGMTKTFAREVARADITANVVAPGPIATDMTAELPEQIREKMVAQIPKQRMGTAEEVAAVIAFLSSAEAGYITGQVFGINGGMLM